MAVSNMDLWDRVSKTDPKNTKKVNVRGGFTSICAQSQIMEATRAFGPVGQGWGYLCDYVFQPNMVVCLISIWHGSEDNIFGPIAGAAKLGGKDDSDAPKKAMTDGLTKGLSHLGFNADIFLGLYDDNKYQAQMAEEFAEKPNYTEMMFNSELKQMTDLLATNPKATNDKLIARIEENFTVSEAMKIQIRGIK